MTTKGYKLLHRTEDGRFVSPVLDYIRKNRGGDWPGAKVVEWAPGEWNEIPKNERVNRYRLCRPGIFHALATPDAVRRFLSLEAGGIDPVNTVLFEVEAEGLLVIENDRFGAYRMRLVGEPAPVMYHL